MVVEGAVQAPRLGLAIMEVRAAAVELAQRVQAAQVELEIHLLLHHPKEIAAALEILM
jgi:hypothetical protein